MTFLTSTLELISHICDEVQYLLKHATIANEKLPVEIPGYKRMTFLGDLQRLKFSTTVTHHNNRLLCF
jgi:hypothetical protein